MNPDSALPRPLDLSVPSNRFAAGGILAGILLGRLNGKSWTHALGAGFGGFAAWAIARELDPDHPESANAALPLATGTALLGQPGLPVGSLVALSGLRVLAGTVGHAPTPLDLTALAGAAALAARAGEPAAALVPGAALGLSALEKDRFSPSQAAALILLAALVPAARSTKAGNEGPALALSVLALACAPALTQPEEVAAPCDCSPVTVSPQRVQRTRQLAALTLAAGLLTRQAAPLTAVAAATLAAGLRRVVAAEGGLSLKQKRSAR
ncbi:hypothetical protein ACFP81_14270 [Deinococcus lacus]|uniref:Uncharacterized protein n=1 Tax=Deinococcus lacus TaxID=392561 RepID=A0ABW1YHJ5_9DEIO